MANVFDVIGDSTRRGILDRLRSEGALSLTELAEPLPISRQAVTKHLDLLEGAGLVARRVAGRERIHELRPEPLAEIDDWLAPYHAFWDERLARLQAHLGEPQPRRKP